MTAVRAGAGHTLQNSGAEGPDLRRRFHVGDSHYVSAGVRREKAYSLWLETGQFFLARL